MYNIIWYVPWFQCPATFTTERPANYEKIERSVEGFNDWLSTWVRNRPSCSYTIHGLTYEDFAS